MDFGDPSGCVSPRASSLFGLASVSPAFGWTLMQTYSWGHSSKAP